MPMLNFFSNDKKESLDRGLAKTKESIFTKLGKAIVGKSTVDEAVLDSVEEALVAADVGVPTTLKIIERIQQRVARDKYMGAAELDRILKEEVAALLAESNAPNREDFDLPKNPKPYVLLVVGVNGVGKTTTIGKLASQYKGKGKTVLLGAADTFRAAAVEQLELWGVRAGVRVISKGAHADPSAVAYETVKEGLDKGMDVVIIDTAGRLHTKVNLMQELTKIKRVIQKVIPDAPHDVLLVLDGSTRQNALNQAREFTKATEVTCMAITKLDRTAKGGVSIGISHEFKIPES